MTPGMPYIPGGSAGFKSQFCSGSQLLANGHPGRQETTAQERGSLTRRWESWMKVWLQLGCRHVRNEPFLFSLSPSSLKYSKKKKDILPIPRILRQSQQ